MAGAAFAEGPARPGARLKLAFTGVAASGEAPSAAARTAGSLVQAQLTALDAYDVVGLDDIQALLGLERQKELLGCSENAEACMAEVVGALNSDRGVSGELARTGGTSVLTLSLLDLRASKSLARVTRRLEGLGADERLLDAIGPAVVELVSADPAMAGRRFSSERGFGGLGLGARAELELVRRSLAPVVFVELSGKRWGGVVAVVVGPTPGFRGEGRFFPLELGRARPFVGVGATVFAPAVGARVVAGVEARLGPVHVSGDAAFERFFNGDLEHSPNAVLVSVGLGWVF